MEPAHLRFVALGIATSTIVLAVVAGFVADGDDFAVAGSIIVVASAFISWAGVGWLRQRPIAPDDPAGYSSTAFAKMAVAEIPVLLGFALAVALGPWSLAAVGVAATLVGLALSWPSESDRERHQLLYLV